MKIGSKWKKVQVSCTDSLKLLVQSVTNRFFFLLHSSHITRYVKRVCYFWQEQEGSDIGESYCIGHAGSMQSSMRKAAT